MAIKSSHLFASTCAIALSLGFLTLQSSAAFALGSTKGQKIRYVPPKDLGVLSVSIPGIFRTDKCDPNTDVTCLTALIPNSTRPTLTISTRPTFFFSVPKGASRVNFMLFEVDRMGKETRIYKTRFTAKIPAGVIGFTLPADAPILKANKTYKWQFTVSILDVPKDVFGTIQRVELSPGLAQQIQNASPLERAAIYANLGIWYDSVKILAELQQSNPNLKKPLPEWVDLLRSVDLEQLALRPLVQEQL